MLHRLDLDSISLKEIIIFIQNNEDDIFVFYNSQKGSNLNKKLIFSLIVYLGKYFPQVSYYFYNIPFCLFKSLGKIFIDEHCIRNRLCNHYAGYVTHDKCNGCTFGLFCNNFNANISDPEIQNLEGFYDSDFVEKEELLNKIYELYRFVLSLGYKESEISFYITQKFMLDFLEGDFLIARDFLQYFTVYFLLGNTKLTNHYFVDSNSFSLIFKKGDTEKKIIDYVKTLGININFTSGNDTGSIREIYFKDLAMKLNYYYSVDIYDGKREFFDFQERDLLSDKKNSIFQGKVYNKRDLCITTKVHLIKKAGDLYVSNTDIYIGRDIISGLNINNYKGILLTSDNLGEKERFYQSLTSIDIPIIYHITPNILEILKDGDSIHIDFNSGIIERCN